jgi:predicted XRE-type DNA-binding protein
MKGTKPIVTRTVNDLARALRLAPSDAAEMSLRRQLNDKIIDAMKRSTVAHADVAKAAGISSGRLHAVLRRDTSQCSTGVLLQILTALGFRPKITFVRDRSAA